VNPAVIRPGDSPQLDAAILDFESLDLLGPVRGQAKLHVDPCKRGGTPPQITVRSFNAEASDPGRQTPGSPKAIATC
jgi:hypothetical protein